MPSKYTPISCSFYDRLETWAVQKQPVEIRYLNAAKEEEQVTTRIMDLQARAGVEYAVLDNGQEIRLDQLIQVNGIPVEPFC